MSSEHALSDADRALLSQRADAFYSAARSRSPTDWEPYLHGVPDRLRPVVLTELVIVDLVRRWARGERPLVEQYVGRFPELGPLDRVSPKLIAEEYRARLKAGEPRDVDQYRRRFPVQFVGLEEELLGIEQESSLRGKSGKSGQFPAAKTVGGGDTAQGNRTAGGGSAASGTIRGTESVRPSGVIASALRSRTDEYTKLKRLGAGQFGEVWLVEGKTTGIKKAMKVMLRAADDETGKRELKSLDLIKNESHPYLLRTEDFWVDDNKLYVLMELADGTLRNWLAQHNPGLESRDYAKGVPTGELLHVLREAAEVMDDLHAKSVMHRDIKPDNILLLNRHAKVADFGLARQQDAGVVTQTMLAGSPAYMAPEVWAGKFGAASDLYSLAITYAELRQGRLPVRLGPIAEIMFAHLEGQFEFAPSLSKAEVGVIRKALAKEPDRRYGSCSEFVAELVRVCNVPLALPGYKVAGGTQARLTGLPPRPPTKEEGAETAGWKGSSAVGTKTGTAPPKKGWQATQSYTPTTRERGTKPPGKAKWVGIAVALGVIVALVAVIALLMFGPRPTPTTSGGGGGTTTDTGDRPTTTKGEGDPTTSRRDPIPGEPWAPLGMKAVPGTETRRVGERDVALWVTKKVNDEEMRFRLIEAVGATKTRAFYISERKVSNQAYRRMGGVEPSAPVTDVTAADAAKFARDNFQSADGRLPTPDEWDHAAGLYPAPKQPNVCNAGGVPWVDKNGPSPARTGPTADKNVNDLLDMAGNGREWTCGVLVKAGSPPGTKPNMADIPTSLEGKFADDDLLVLRGRSYTLKDGLTFATLKNEVTTEPQTQYAGSPSPYTGFRVVLPLQK